MAYWSGEGRDQVVARLEASAPPTVREVPHPAGRPAPQPLGGTFLVVARRPLDAAVCSPPAGRRDRGGWPVHRPGANAPDDPTEPSKGPDGRLGGRRCKPPGADGLLARRPPSPERCLGPPFRAQRRPRPLRRPGPDLAGRWGGWPPSSASKSPRTADPSGHRRRVHRHEGPSRPTGAGRRGVLKDRTAFFRRGSSGAGRAAVSDETWSRYNTRVAELAPRDLLAWLTGTATTRAMADLVAVALEHVRAACFALPEVTERLEPRLAHVLHPGQEGLRHVPERPPRRRSPGPLGGGWARVQAELVDEEPDRFFVPPYVGHRGWLGVRLDRAPDWAEVAGIAEDAYRQVAPKTLLAQLDAR